MPPFYARMLALMFRVAPWARPRCDLLVEGHIVDRTGARIYRDESLTNPTVHA